MMEELTEFLRARLQDDEWAAQDATEGPWMIDYADGSDEPAGIYGSSRMVVSGGLSATDAEHIVRNDPFLALAEVNAKRHIIALCEAPTAPADPGGEPWGLAILKQLAAPYSHHTDYCQEWKP